MWLDWPAIEAFLVGRCGLTEEQAARTGYHEYLLRVKGKDEELQERWALARWMMWQEMLLSPNIKQGHKPRTPQAFCRFPWEQSEAEELAEKAKQYRSTPEEVTELNRIMAEWEASKASKTENEDEQDR